MGELQVIGETLPFWKAFAWCFYPITALLALDLIFRDFDDDDDEGGGMMIPVYQGSRG